MAAFVHHMAAVTVQIFTVVKRILFCITLKYISVLIEIMLNDVEQF